MIYHNHFDNMTHRLKCGAAVLATLCATAKVLAQEQQAAAVADMRLAVHDAMIWSRFPQQLRAEQKQWERSHAAECKRSDCSQLYQGRIKWLENKKRVEVAHAGDDGVTPSDATSRLNLAGSYIGADTAAESVFGALKIDEQLISWQPPAPNRVCRAKYSIVSRRLDGDVKAVDGSGTARLRFVLKLEGDSCAAPYTNLVLQFEPRKYASMTMSFIRAAGQEQGAIRFYLD